MSQTNIENFDISQTLPVIACDYESLKSWALAYVSRYKDLVITEDQVKEIKKDMAEINKAKQNLERARIDAVKAVSAPIKAFEARIKEVCAIFDEAYNKLSKQVKEFEKWERAEKLIDVQNLINDLIQKTILDNPELRNKISIPVNDKWLNKTVTFNAIQEEINATIADQIRAEKERQRIEKAQAERRLLIENAVKAANEKYGLSMHVAFFMHPSLTNLDVSAEEILQTIEEEAKGRKEIPLPVDPPQKMAPEMESAEKVETPAPEHANNLIMFRLTALFTPEQEDRVREILNQNHFMKIVRQLQGIGVDVEFSKVSAND